MTNLGFDVITIFQNPPTALAIFGLILALASIIFGFGTIFIIRAELERHYSEKEHFGLQLSGTMTFFFSFVYFQYHLYDIAKIKRDEATDRIKNAGITFIK